MQDIGHTLLCADLKRDTIYRRLRYSQNERLMFFFSAFLQGVIYATVISIPCRLQVCKNFGKENDVEYCAVVNLSVFSVGKENYNFAVI